MEIRDGQGKLAWIGMGEWLGSFHSFSSRCVDGPIAERAPVAGLWSMVIDGSRLSDFLMGLTAEQWVLNTTYYFVFRIRLSAILVFLTEAILLSTVRNETTLYALRGYAWRKDVGAHGNSTMNICGVSQVHTRLVPAVQPPIPR